MRTQPLTLLPLTIIILFTIFSCGEWNPDAPTDQELINAFQQNEAKFEQLADILESIYIYEPITLKYLTSAPVTKIDSIKYLLNENNLAIARIVGRRGKCPCIQLLSYSGKLGHQKLEMGYTIKQNKCSTNVLVEDNQKMIDVAKQFVRKGSRATHKKIINDKWDIFIRTDS